MFLDHDAEGKEPKLAIRLMELCGTGKASAPAGASALRPRAKRQEGSTSVILEAGTAAGGSARARRRTGGRKGRS